MACSQHDRRVFRDISGVNDCRGDWMKLLVFLIDFVPIFTVEEDLAADELRVAIQLWVPDENPFGFVMSFNFAQCHHVTRGLNSLPRIITWRANQAYRGSPMLGSILNSSMACWTRCLSNWPRWASRLSAAT